MRAIPRIVRRAWCSALFVAGCACVLLLTGCIDGVHRARAGSLSNDAPHCGHLLIVGGGLDDNNAEISGLFTRLAGEGRKIGVVPTASGEETPGEKTAERIRKYILPGQTIEVVPLTKDDIGKGDDVGVVAQIDRCSALWFVGGDQARILAVFRPGGKDSEAYNATRRLLSRGGVVAGTSAGAAMMSDPMITGGTSKGALVHGAEWTVDPNEGVGLAPGMGFCKGILIDQHFLERDRLGRLLVAMDETKDALGVGIPENCALHIDLSTGGRTPVSAPGVIEVSRDRDGAKRVRLIAPGAGR